MLALDLATVRSVIISASNRGFSKVTGFCILPRMEGKFVCFVGLLVPKYRQQYQGWARIEKFQISITRSSGRYSTVQYIIVQYSTVYYSTVQYRTLYYCIYTSLHCFNTALLSLRSGTSLSLIAREAFCIIFCIMGFLYTRRFGWLTAPFLLAPAEGWGALWVYVKI